MRGITWNANICDAFESYCPTYYDENYKLNVYLYKSKYIYTEVSTLTQKKVYLHSSKYTYIITLKQKLDTYTEVSTLTQKHA